jgi:hypothetical protein
MKKEVTGSHSRVFSFVAAGPPRRLFSSHKTTMATREEQEAAARVAFTAIGLAPATVK